MPEFKSINTHQAQELISSQDITVIDVRDELAYKEGHIAGAILINQMALENFLRSTDKNKPLLCYCYHGFSSQNASMFFSEQGFREVYSLVGGFEEWRAAFPFVSEKEK